MSEKAILFASMFDEPIEKIEKELEKESNYKFRKGNHNGTTRSDKQFEENIKESVKQEKIAVKLYADQVGISHENIKGAGASSEEISFDDYSGKADFVVNGEDLEVKVHSQFDYGKMSFKAHNVNKYIKDNATVLVFQEERGILIDKAGLEYIREKYPTQKTASVMGGNEVYKIVEFQTIRDLEENRYKVVYWSDEIKEKISVLKNNNELFCRKSYRS